MKKKSFKSFEKFQLTKLESIKGGKMALVDKGTQEVTCRPSGGSVDND